MHHKPSSSDLYFLKLASDIHSTMGNVNSILFRPPEVTPLHPNCRFFLTNSYGNRIPACFFRRIGASVTLLYSHANAEDLGLMFGWIKCLSRRLNVNVLAFDYTGYGESDGRFLTACI